MTVYANGQAPESALVVVDGRHVVPSIAERVQAFLDYSAQEGQPQHIVYLGGYCNLAEQAARRGTPSTGSTVTVALPGNSTHGDYAKGRVDLVGSNGRNYDSADLAFQIAHCPDFGLVREFGDRDPNHWMESGPWVPPITHQVEEDDLMIEAVKNPATGDIVLVGEFTFEIVADFTGSRYLHPGTAYREVDQSFLTFHQQLVAKNRAALAVLANSSTPVDYAALAKAVNDDLAKRIET